MNDKKQKSSLIYILAGIGIVAVIYCGWTVYRRHFVEQQARQYLSAPVPPGLPNPLFGTPAPAPPQP